MKFKFPIFLALFLTLVSISIGDEQASVDKFRPFLKASSYKHYIDTFNANDAELYVQFIPNKDAWDFLENNIPLLDCPDKTIEEIYYFRWWTFRKHIKETPEGYVITEFLPQVGWAGKYNTISCAAGHHLYEGRWLADHKYTSEYSKFWFKKDASPRKYSFWAADAIWAVVKVSGDYSLAKQLLPSLITNYTAWEKYHRDTNGLFWQEDGRDGMEESISGDLQSKHLGYRATINSYMYGDALAISQIAGLASEKKIADLYRMKAATIKKLTQDILWDPKAHFFKVLPRSSSTTLSDARELHGYTPWYFNLPDTDKSIAWEQLMDPKGFYAPFGLTTAEQRHPKFSLSYEGHECQWNGPTWPYATSVTLTALANLLNNYDQTIVNKKDYLNLLTRYAESQYLKRDDGKVTAWIDENINPITGDWISRTRLKKWKNGTWDPAAGGKERGKDYNHSTFCDLIISGLIGLRPRPDDVLDINPLIPEGTWDHFCLDYIHYHGHLITIFYDLNGQHYGKGTGLHIYSDNFEIARTDKLSHIIVSLKTDH